MKRCLLLSVFISMILIGSFTLFSSISEKSFSKQITEHENRQEETKSMEENEINFEGGNYDQFKALNEDVVMALHFSDRVLPVVYNQDNEFYVRRNLMKEASSMGTPFVDKHCGLHSKNMLIHAHSSLKNEGMFTFFKYFCNQEYYEQHSVFKTEDEQGMKEMEIFAVIQCDLNLDDYRDWMKSGWRNEAEFMNFIEEIRRRSLIDSKTVIKPDEEIMTLVTCDMSVENGRFLVFAKEKKYEKEDNKYEEN